MWKWQCVTSLFILYMSLLAKSTVSPWSTYQHVHASVSALLWMISSKEEQVGRQNKQCFCLSSGRKYLQRAAAEETTFTKQTCSGDLLVRIQIKRVDSRWTSRETTCLCDEDSQRNERLEARRDLGANKNGHGFIATLLTCGSFKMHILQVKVAGCVEISEEVS